MHIQNRQIALPETSMQNTETILAILVAVIAVAGLIQLIILFVLFLALRKAMKLGGEYAADMRDKVVPVLEHSKAFLQTSKQLITRLEPKLEAAATDLAELVHTANAEAKKLQESTDEITERVRRQAARVDEVTTEALNGLERVGQILNQVVTVPVRQVSGVVAAARAIFETLRSPTPPRDGHGGQRPRS
jgi:methyl-accepting chemotaxis protein